MPEPETSKSATAPYVHPHSATLRRLEKSSGSLAAQAIARMDETLPWYRAMPPENRSWIGLVAQAGIAAFTEWFRHPDAPQAISTDVFGTAPRELTRAITLRQTVEMVRTTMPGISMPWGLGTTARSVTAPVPRSTVTPLTCKVPGRGYTVPSSSTTRIWRLPWPFGPSPSSWAWSGSSTSSSRSRATRSTCSR